MVPRVTVAKPAKRPSAALLLSVRVSPSATGLPLLSSTAIVRVVVPPGASWAGAALMLMVSGAPATKVTAVVALTAPSAEVAVRVAEPRLVGDCNCTVATPLALVMAVTVCAVPPVLGKAPAVVLNSTSTLAAGLPWLLVRVALI